MKIIIILLVFSFFIFSNKINAQLYSYTFYESTQSYSELTNAHLSTAIGDEGFEDIILPFKFFISYPYPDSLFSDNLRLFVNGLVQINTPFNSTTNLNDFSNPQISRVLAPFWDDLIADIQTEIKYKTTCLLYTSDAADERSSVDLGGRRIIKKKNQYTKCEHQHTSKHNKKRQKKKQIQ